MLQNRAKSLNLTSVSDNEFRIHAQTTDFVLGSWQNVVLVFWLRCTPPQGTIELGRVLELVSSGHPAGIGVLTVISASATPPSGATREAIAQTLMNAAHSIKYSAVVLEGTGFRAAMVRAIVSGIMQLGRFPFPHRVVDWDGAINNIADAAGPAVDRGAHKLSFLRAVRALRHEVDCGASLSRRTG